jgi:M6 family metalloprotease-like protein
MRIKFIAAVIHALVLSLLSPSAFAQPISDCRVKASSFQQVSLGFPVNPERLSKITNPKILVIPYRLKGEDSFDFGSKEKEIFSGVSDNIYAFSNGRSRVTFIYNSIIDLDMTVKERNSIKAPNNSYSEWQERYDKSTWGFMKKFIVDQDKNIDFSNIDAVILFSSSVNVNAENAEAMMMTKDLYGPWFNPISTSEGIINNVVVLYNHNSDYVLTHEVMHLFGLTDLYGSSSSAQNSLMSDGVIGLLAWEKWLLGWLDDENIQCVSETTDIDLDSVNNNFSLEYSNRDQLLVIPTGTKTALVIDLVKRDGRSWISYYALDNDARPPIAAFSSNSSKLSTEITGRLGVGTYIESSEYTLLIKDNDGQKLSLNLIPKSLSGSESAKQLIATAENTRITYVKLDQAELEAASAAELKIKQEAEAKIVADKVAVDLKAKQEADAKAAADKAATARKKTTITCVKGKLTKKVTAVKPVCPKGYKKK